VPREAPTAAEILKGVPVATIKRHVTAKGNASKEAVIAAVRALGHNPEDDNEADAITLPSDVCFKCFLVASPCGRVGNRRGFTIGLIGRLSPSPLPRFLLAVLPTPHNPLPLFL
jgi:hypothetical protein